MHRRTFLAALGAGSAAIALGVNGPASAQAVQGPINLTRVGFERRTFESSLGEMAVFTGGEGEPLLLLHGLGAGASSFLWYTLAPELAKEHRVIAPDFIGWGESFRPGRYLLFDDYVKQISELGQWIGEPTKAVVSSLACGFLLKAFADGQIDVSRVALHSPSGGLDFGIDASSEQATAIFRRLTDSPQRDAFYEQNFLARPLVESWYRRNGFLDPQAVPQEVIDAALFNARQPNAVYSIFPFLNGELRYDIAPYLETVSIPATMIWGVEEIQIPRAAQEKIWGVNKDIALHRIEEARSSFEIEQPERTLAVLMPFLRKP